MALTNIELYEELKKDLSERPAQMIAGIVPSAEDVATKGDVLRSERATRDDIAELERTTTRLQLLIVDLDRKMEQRFSEQNWRFFAFFAVPLWGGVAAAIVKLFLH